MDLSWLFTADTAISFLTLSMLEIVLGIDNLVFIALVTQRLPEEMRAKARFVGIGLALMMRIAMLFGVAWIMTLTNPIFEVLGRGISVKDLLLLVGGLFLLGKATLEMHHDVAGEHEAKEVKVANAFTSAVIQITLIDLVFSFDSIITAVGITQHLPVIIAAVIVSMAVMLAASGTVSAFLQNNPTFKVLALAFVMMIGMLLVAEGLGLHFPRGYIYFAMGFSIFIEVINTLARKKRKGRSVQDAA